MEPVVGVLALQGDVREHLAALEASGARTARVRRAAELAALDGIVLPGGESTTMQTLLRAFDLFDPLRAALAAGLPAYGSCAGMILLAARVLDGTPGQESLGVLDVTVRRNAFGRQVDSFEGALRVAPSVVAAAPAALVAARGPGTGDVAQERQSRAVFIRAPWVEEVGPRVEVLATVDAGPAAGRIVAVRDRRVMATSFHPEVAGDLRFHRMFVDLARERA